MENRIKVERRNLDEDHPWFFWRTDTSTLSLAHMRFKKVNTDLIFNKSDIIIYHSYNVL